MENSENLGFQFESTKAFQPDSNSGENWETCSSADSELSTTTRNKHQLILGTCVTAFKC